MWKYLIVDLGRAEGSGRLILTELTKITLVVLCAHASESSGAASIFRCPELVPLIIIIVSNKFSDHFYVLLQYMDK